MVLHLAPAALEADDVAHVAQDANEASAGKDFTWATIWGTHATGVAHEVAHDGAHGDGVDSSDGAPGPPQNGEGEEWTEWSA